VTPTAARSFLYAPGDRPERFDRALGCGTDAVIFDLEDGVAPAATAQARAHIAAALATPPSPGAGPGGTQRWVRVNTGGAMGADLDAVLGRPGLTGVIVPKATVASVGAALAAGAPAVGALIETAAGVLEAEALASTAGVSHLALGETDLAADLGIELSPDGVELAPLRLRLVVASAAAGIAAPTGPVSTAFRDLDGLRASTEALRRTGYGSRACIHPDQVTVVNDVLTPSPEAVAEAADLIARLEAAGGGVCLDARGHMVDEAVARAARRLLSRAR
jgi:citrate lyase subunit beta / citryl-CoA lyase